MSKAFTKEDQETDFDPSEDAQDQELKSLPQHINYITPVGHQKLKTELSELLNKTRPEMTQIVAWAASNGDRSENGDYLYGKKRLREIDRRIRFLTKRLEMAQVIRPADVAQDPVRSKQVQFGATVTLKNLTLESQPLKTISIFGIDESDPSAGKISWISPLAKALLGHQEGDEITLHLPKGDEDWEILKIQYL